MFADGRVVALACTMCHHQDVGGRTPGSVPTDATELYQEGVIIPPTQLFRAGELDENLFGLLAAQRPAARHVHRRSHGPGGGGAPRRHPPARAVRRATAPPPCWRYIDELLTRAETLTRARRSRRSPTASYTFEDWLDNDGVDSIGPVKIQVTVRVRGSSMTFDFTGTDPQVRGPFNSVPASTLSAVYYAIRAVSDPTVPNNGGCFRAVDAVLPEGSARQSAAARAGELPHGDHQAHRRHHPRRPGAARCPTACRPRTRARCSSWPSAAPIPATGRPFVASELAAGGMGARPGKDGIDVIETDVSNCMNIPVESVEMSFPLRIRAGAPERGLGRGRTVPRRARAGEGLRGDDDRRHGLAPRRALRLVAVGPLRRRARAPAGPRLRRCARTDAARRSRPRRCSSCTRATSSGSTSPGGAGYGDPLERDPDLVLADVLDGKVSATEAAADYGVVLTPAARRWTR